ncbi:MAG: hypothetical protein WCD13_03095, partial [Pseudolabrys sp.]
LRLFCSVSNCINILRLSTATITQPEPVMVPMMVPTLQGDPAAARSNASSETSGVKTSTSRVALLRLTVFSSFAFWPFSCPPFR